MKNNKKKKILICVISVCLVLALGAGIWFGVGRGRSEPVFVFEFYNMGMTEFWGDNQESYGPVSSDNIQTVFLSETQKVTDIKVQPGDQVKKGDLLMSFDTSLSDLELERKRLDVEKLKLQIEGAQKELRRINGLKPMQLPPPAPDPEDSPEPDVNLGTAIGAPYRISNKIGYDGSSAEKALICWVRSDTPIDAGLFAAILAQSEKMQNAIPQQSHASAPQPDYGDVFDQEGETTAPTTAPTDPTTAPTDPTTAPTDPTTAPTDPTTAPTDPTTDPTAPTTDPTDPTTDPTDPSEDPTEPEYIEVNDCYVVLKITAGDMSLGMREVWQGLHIRRNGSYSFRFFNAGAMGDYTLTMDPSDGSDGSVPDMPDFDIGSGMTASQIAQMRAEQQKKIQELEFSHKMAEANYKIMQAEVNDGNVYADSDGVVVSVLSEEEARSSHQPILKVSGGGGFYIECSVSELVKDDILIGQNVVINDWNTGMTYDGEVASIGDFPVLQNGYNGMSNPNVSYYPFYVFVDESANLQTGSYVSVTYSAGESENGIYLEKPFVRTENGQSFVYVQGGDGRLEKRNVITGKSLWGSYTEITSGLSAEDFIAFPYGKNVKPGARTVVGDMSDLYNR